MLILFTVLFIVVVPIGVAIVYSDEVTLGLELNLLQKPFFRIGIMSERYYLADGSVEDELSIGLLFINIVMIFYKKGR
jgi:hypothetical protein